MSDTASTAAPISPNDPLLSKVQKYLDVHQTKIKKLQEENGKLRAQITELKSANSRVRRIPKPAAAAAPTTAA